MAEGKAGNTVSMSLIVGRRWPHGGGELGVQRVNGCESSVGKEEGWGRKYNIPRTLAEQERTMRGQFEKGGHGTMSHATE